MDTIDNEPLRAKQNHVTRLIEIVLLPNRGTSFGHLLPAINALVLIRVPAFPAIGSSTREHRTGLLFTIPDIDVFRIVELRKNPVIAAFLLIDKLCCSVLWMQRTNAVSIVRMCLCKMQ